MKNKVLSGFALSMTENVIGSLAGGIGAYQLGTRLVKADGFMLVAITIAGAFAGSMIQSAILGDKELSNIN